MSVSDSKHLNCSFLPEYKARADLNSVKYCAFLYKVDYLDLLYDCSLEFTKLLAVSGRFRDLQGAKYILTKFNKTYPDDLYSSNTETSIRQAVNYFDLYGIRYISQNLQYYSHLHIYQLIHLRSDEERLFLAIDLNDIDGVKLIISKNYLSEDSYLIALKHAYYKELFEISEYMISSFIIRKYQNIEGLIREIFSGIMRSNPFRAYDEYCKHIINLSEIEKSILPIEAIQSLVNAIHHSRKNKSTFYRLNAIYTDSSIDETWNFLTAQNSQHFTVIEVLTYLKYTKGIDLFIPNIGVQYVSPFYSPFQVINLFKDHRIYISSKSQTLHALLTHELSHFLFYTLMQNNGLPYIDTDIDMIESYQSAVYNTLINVFMNFTKKTHSNFTDPKLKALLWLNSWNYTNKNETNLTNSLFQHFFGNISIKNSDKILILQKKYKEIVESYQWKEDHKYVLERILDYLNRDNSTQDQEFIVRIPEFYVYGVEDDIMTHFEPITKYWKQYISPMVKKIQTLHFMTCQNKVIKQQTLAECVHTLLQEHVKTIFKTAFEQKCERCFTDITQISYLTKFLPLQTKKDIVSYAAREISFCTEYCFEKQNCKVIPVYGIIDNVFQYVQSWLGCTKIYSNTNDTMIHWPENVIRTMLNDEPSIVGIERTDYNSDL